MTGHCEIELQIKQMKSHCNI